MNDIVLRPSYWASFSGGKDSLYMINIILENPQLYPLDGIIHFELEIDYPFIKNVCDFVEEKCKKLNIPFIRIKPDKTWEELFCQYLYPNRIIRWCNSKYKLNAKKQMQNFLKSKGQYLVSYIGFCADEKRRFKDTKYERYPLAEFGIIEKDILEWAKNVPIFNDYYKYNKRCGCMGCPVASLSHWVYLASFYPNEYNYFVDKMLESERGGYRPFANKSVSQLMSYVERHKDLFQPNLIDYIEKNR